MADTESKTANQIVIDAKNATLGRLCSFAAKQSLLGKSVIIVNCSLAVITGRRRAIIEKYLASRSRVGSSQKGPKVSKEPFKIVKRAVRGMLSHRQGRGEAALDRVICYNNIPEEYASSRKVISGKDKANVDVISLKDLS